MIVNVVQLKHWIKSLSVLLQAFLSSSGFFHAQPNVWADSLGLWRTMNAVWSSSVLFKVSKRFNHSCTQVQHCVSSILASLWEWWNFTSFHRRRLCWAESLGPWRTMNAVWSSSVLFKVSKRFNHGCTPVSEWVCSFLTAHQHKKAI